MGLVPVQILADGTVAVCMVTVSVLGWTSAVVVVERRVSSWEGCALGWRIASDANDGTITAQMLARLSYVQYN